ncbi:MAG: hypothetical protein AVDCRST_MAG50-3106 [uncultured Acidimicrobiales bacterium]|uniref:Lipoprotein n=1 Tax=uncultured Acidimicrobiales bacterium TaxID=310071 RepID=A0A6J4J2N4_9ACTN|nr:MAG: hypothetical protein AVDCRST_MAG50-3106 [uncultured Acidimicrobiales bacterium]
MQPPAPLLALSLGVLLHLVGCSGGSRAEPVEWAVIEEPNGTTYQLRARFGGSSCTEFEEWQVEETNARVEVQAIVTFTGGADDECTADLVFEPHTLRLSAPLGSRELIGCDPPEDRRDCTEVIPPRIT